MPRRLGVPKRPSLSHCVPAALSCTSRLCFHANARCGLVVTRQNLAGAGSAAAAAAVSNGVVRVRMCDGVALVSVHPLFFIPHPHRLSIALVVCVRVGRRRPIRDATARTVPRRLTDTDSRHAEHDTLEAWRR